MHKRNFIAGCAATLSSLMAHQVQATSAEGSNIRVAQAGGMEFGWHHAGGRLHSRLSAPTRGWIAVGFNAAQGLRNTRFVIAAVSTRPIRVEEHIALVPTHESVANLGMAGTLDHIRGGYENDTSYLHFSLPLRFTGQPGLSLKPGSKNYLMLAWSHETDFAHHSAWRRHLDIIL